MKVFELMQELSKHPAGAEVRFRTLMTLAEFAAQPVEGDDDSKGLYTIDRNIEEVEEINKTLISIYS